MTEEKKEFDGDLGKVGISKDREMMYKTLLKAYINYLQGLSNQDLVKLIEFEAITYQELLKK